MRRRTEKQGWCHLSEWLIFVLWLCSRPTGFHRAERFALNSAFQCFICLCIRVIRYTCVPIFSSETLHQKHVSHWWTDQRFSHLCKNSLSIYVRWTMNPSTLYIRRQTQSVFGPAFSVAHFLDVKMKSADWLELKSIHKDQYNFGFLCNKLQSEHQHIYFAEFVKAFTNKLWKIDFCFF